MNRNSVLLTTAYLPSLSYLREVLRTDDVVLEGQEHFVKQTYRNRCEILTANGTLSLSIPLEKQADKEITCRKRISYAENWQQQHWRTITSAYKGSPYFEFFEDDLRPFYEQRFELLMDYNTALLKSVLHILRVKKEIRFTEHYDPHPADIKDLRVLPHPAKEAIMPYYQVFSIGSEFVPGLSCIDALFNIGLETKTL
jgi:hypothetical protein